MNVYDFDHTIYDGDSSVDFYLFVLCRRPHLLIFLPFQVWGMILFLLGIYSKERMKEAFFIFIRYIPVQETVCRFWDHNRKKIKSWYLSQKSDTDVIISASPEFLLEPLVCGYLGVALIASRIDVCTGKYMGKNCFGEEKVTRLYAAYPHGIIKNFYSDSLSDAPLAEKAQQSFMVSRNNSLSIIQKLFIGILVLGLIGFISLLFGGIRNYCIYIVGKLLIGRPFNNHGTAHYFISIIPFAGIFICFMLIVAVIFYRRLLLSVKEFLNIAPNKQIFRTAFKDIFIEQPFLLISFIFILYIIKNIFMAINITWGGGRSIIILTILIHFLISFFVYKRKNKNNLIYILTCYSILIFSLIVSSIIYDYSWDGMAYHQTAAIKIYEGWNPFYENLPESSVFIWSNHYPKFTEIFTSIFLSAFGNIEMGKSYNIIFFVIVFFYACKYANQFQKNKLVVLLISIIFTANPVVLAQFFTFYLDGVLGMMIIILIFACMDYEQKQDARDLFIIIAISIFSIDTKFTGFICGFVLIGYVIKQFAARKYKKMAIFILAGFSVLLIGVVFTGYNPYITNIKYFGHPFYPLFGKEPIDIMSMQLTEQMTYKGFNSMHPVQRFFSLFFLQFDLKTLPFNPMKLLRLASFSGFDVRIGGFGVLFAEFFIFLLLILFFTLKRKRTANYKKLLFPICLLLFMTIIMPENWWAKYIPYFWYLFGFLIMASDYSLKINKRLFLVSLMIVSVNSGVFYFFNSVQGVKYTMDFKRFITEIKQNENDTIHIVLDYDYFSYSIAEKLRYYNIKKNIVFIHDEDKPFSNRVGFGIKDWY